MFEEGKIEERAKENMLALDKEKENIANGNRTILEVSKVPH
jgi:hypothetical protein